MGDPVAWYDANAEAAAARSERVEPERLHGWMVDLLPAAPAAALDVGSGSGRDAAWLSSRGYHVVAVEPSARMRAIARARHADPAIRWQLPAASRVYAARVAQFREASRTARRHRKQRSWCRSRLTRRFQV